MLRGDHVATVSPGSPASTTAPAHPDASRTASICRAQRDRL